MLRIDAINRVLVSAQLQPVTTLAAPDRFVSKAATIVDDTVLRELEKGWNFNTDYNKPILAVAGIIATPTGTLSIKVRPENANGKDITERNGQLYDKTNRTNVFTEAQILCDVSIEITFDNCPRWFQEYVVSSASAEFAIKVSVDPQIAAQLQREWYEARARMKGADTEQSGSSLFGRGPLWNIARRWPRLNGWGSR